MYALPMNVGELSCFAGAVVGAALAGAAKPARRRATRETRATVFIKETPVQGRCQRTIYPTILVVWDNCVLWVASVDSLLNKIVEMEGGACSGIRPGGRRGAAASRCPAAMMRGGETAKRSLAPVVDGGGGVLRGPSL